MRTFAFFTALLIGGVTAISVGGDCNTKQISDILQKSSDAASAFCSDLLGTTTIYVPVSATTSVTVTQSGALITAKTKITITNVSTAPTSTSTSTKYIKQSVYVAGQKAKRAPTCRLLPKSNPLLVQTYGAADTTSACSCLVTSSARTTVTTTAETVTVTATAALSDVTTTVTETDTVSTATTPTAAAVATTNIYCDLPGCYKVNPVAYQVGLTTLVACKLFCSIYSCDVFQYGSDGKDTYCRAWSGNLKLEDVYDSNNNDPACARFRFWNPRCDIRL